MPALLFASGSRTRGRLARSVLRDGSAELGKGGREGRGRKGRGGKGGRH